MPSVTASRSRGFSQRASRSNGSATSALCAYSRAGGSRGRFGFSNPAARGVQSAAEQAVEADAQLVAGGRRRRPRLIERVETVADVGHLRIGEPAG